MHKRALSFLSWGKWGGKLTFIWMCVEWLILRMCIPRATFWECIIPHEFGGSIENAMSLKDNRFSQKGSEPFHLISDFSEILFIPSFHLCLLVALSDHLGIPGAWNPPWLSVLF